MQHSELAIPAHNNQHLFSDHYLNEVVVARPQWRALRNESKVVMEKVASIFADFVPSDRERQTERDLVMPVLKALRHTFEVQAGLRTPEGVKGPDYVFYRDAAALAANKGKVLTDALPQEGGIAVGDAKRWNRPLDALVKEKTSDKLSNKNPAYQIYYYMLHSGVVWGILTNGKLWRLYHKDTAHKLDHFYEVDLEELTQAADSERFLYFYAFFRREALDDGPLSLNSILRESVDYAANVGNSLKSQVYDALRHIAQGFLDYAPNALPPDSDTLETIHDNSLILLYRLIFILYAEARELLPVRGSSQYRNAYSMHAIKNAVADDLMHGKYLLSDSALLWPRLQQLFEIINLGSPPLKVATFNGGLFDPDRHDFLAKHVVGDAHLQQAVDMLSRVDGEFVDYRDLSVRHMGTIYEGLLEYRFRPLDAPEGGWSVELVNDKGDRKATGSYYTPDSVVKYIVERTVGPVLEQAIESRKSDAQRLQAVMEVNVLDPAMGSGHFLVEATEYIARFLVDAGVQPEGKTQEEADLAFWKRRVVQSCIYGVDLNPLAVELAKLSLWLTTVAKDRPLSFLDHHLRPGNSLVGARLEHLMVGTVASRKSRGKKAPDDKQIVLFENSAFTQKISTAVNSMWLIEESEAQNVGDVKEQERLYEALRGQLAGKYSRLLNLVAASRFGVEVAEWLWPSLKKYADENNGTTFPAFEKLLKQADEVAARERFFHWEMEFPEVYFDRAGRPLGKEGGFEAVIGNPPWERIKLQENEFFAARDKAIALAPKAADRRRLIAALPKKKPELWREYEQARASSEYHLAYMQKSGFYPLMGRGDTNLYAIFAERALQLMADAGRAGVLVPSGIATDDTTKHYFQDIVNRRMLAELWDFENRDGLFPEVHRSFKFSIILMTGEGSPQDTIRCGFFLHSTEEMDDPDRISLLTPQDFRLFNPNTLTCPIFRRRRDGELARKIYENAPIFISKEGAAEVNPWEVRLSTMFHMTNDSHLFRTAVELVADGYWLGEGNVYHKADSHYVPLYEGKMVQMYDHRAAGIVVNPANLHRPAQEKQTTEVQRRDPAFSVMPQFWVDHKHASRCLIGVTSKWLLGFKSITAPTNVRSFICAVLPPFGVGNSMPLLLLHDRGSRYAGPCLVANLSAFALDFAARQKIGGQNLNFFVVEQFPVLPPQMYEADWQGVRLAGFIKERVLELCYTAHDLKGFAEDVGYDGPPFAWDEERRLHLRCQLDALYFHLYKLTGDEAAEIMETFPIVKRQDEARYGGFRTRDLILAYYRAYAAGDMSAWVKG